MKFLSLLSLPLLTFTLGNPLPDHVSAVAVRDADNVLAARTYYQHDYRCHDDKAKNNCKKHGGEWACTKHCECVKAPHEGDKYCPLEVVKKTACDVKGLLGYEWKADGCKCEKKEKKEKEHKDKEHKDKEHKDKEHKDNEHMGNEHKDKEHKENEHKDKEHKDKGHKDKEHKEPEHKGNEYKEPEHKEPEHKDKEHKGNEHKEPEHKDKEHKDKEHKGNEHKEPEYKEPEHKEKDPKEKEHKKKECKDLKQILACKLKFKKCDSDCKCYD